MSDDKIDPINPRLREKLAKKHDAQAQAEAKKNTEYYEAITDDPVLTQASDDTRVGE